MFHAERWRSLCAQLAQLAPDRHVLLIAVSKGQPAPVLRAARDAGQRAFGESYLQEALAKQAALRDLDLEWHFIGPLQSNKTAAIATHFQWVHSVDRLKIAQRLSDARMAAQLPPLPICLQVNLSGEASKSGLAPAALAAAAVAIGSLPGVKLRGLMAIPEPTPDVELQHQRFAELRQLAEQLNRGGMQLDTLSMGMSNDFAAAVAEGSTMVRIGTALFGPRRKES